MDQGGLLDLLHRLFLGPGSFICPRSRQTQAPDPFAAEGREWGDPAKGSAIPIPVKPFPFPYVVSLTPKNILCALDPLY